MGTWQEKPSAEITAARPVPTPSRGPEHTAGDLGVQEENPPASPTEPALSPADGKSPTGKRRTRKDYRVDRVVTQEWEHLQIC